LERIESRSSKSIGTAKVPLYAAAAAAARVAPSTTTRPSARLAEDKFVIGGPGEPPASMLGGECRTTKFISPVSRDG
jgi:hypothetical protein